jgi:hypothetical protein
MNPSMLARLDEVRKSGVLIAEDGLVVETGDRVASRGRPTARQPRPRA